MGGRRHPRSAGRAQVCRLLHRCVALSLPLSRLAVAPADKRLPCAAGDEVVAVASMQNDPIAAHVSELFRLGKMLGAKEIRAGKSPLEVQLA